MILIKLGAKISLAWSSYQASQIFRADLSSKTKIMVMNVSLCASSIG